MYELIITWHTFQNHDEENEVLRASGITMDAVIEILKMYQCSPSLHIKIREIIILNPTPEQADKIKEVCNETESYSCVKSDKFNIRR